MLLFSACASKKIVDENAGLQENQIKHYYFVDSQMHGPQKMVIMATPNEGVYLGVNIQGQLMQHMNKRELWHFKNALAKAREWIEVSLREDIDLEKKVPKSMIPMYVSTAVINKDGNRVGRSIQILLKMRDSQERSKTADVIVFGIDPETSKNSNVISQGDQIERFASILDKIPVWAAKEREKKQKKANLFK